MSTTSRRILALVLAAGAVSILLAPRTRVRPGARPWRIDEADTPVESPPPDAAEADPTQPANAALH